MAEAPEPLAAAEREFFTYEGPVPGVKYPVKVLYCGGKEPALNQLWTIAVFVYVLILFYKICRINFLLI